MYRRRNLLLLNAKKGRSNNFEIFKKFYDFHVVMLNSFILFVLAIAYFFNPDAPASWLAWLSLAVLDIGLHLLWRSTPSSTTTYTQ